MDELHVLDTETASLEGGVCDIAIALLDENLDVRWTVESLIDPERPISPQASGIHHIVDADVWEAPTLAEFMDMHNRPFQREGLVLCAHNVAFDIRMVAAELPESYDSVCTLKLSRLMWPRAPDHKLQTLRYMFGLESGTAHRAMGDVTTCISLLRLIAEKKGIGLSGLRSMCREPLSLDMPMPFGKHKGVALGSLPISYVRWMVDQPSLDADLREALAQRINS